MLRDNLAGLIEPMIDCAGAHAFGGHPKQEPTGGCSRSTELTIVVLERSWRHVFRWKTGQRAENGKPPAFEVTTAAHDSRAVATAQHQSHRTIDPQCLKKSPPRRGGIYALTENVALHFTLSQDRLSTLGAVMLVVIIVIPVFRRAPGHNAGTERCISSAQRTRRESNPTI